MPSSAWLKPMMISSAIGTAPLGARSHSTSVRWSSAGQQQQRGDQPGAEQQQRDAGHPLGQPMLAALARRAEAADLAERGRAVAEAHCTHSQKIEPRSARSGAASRRWSGSRTVLLVPSSKPAPVSITRWRMPDSRCWKKAQVRPTSTTSPTGCCRDCGEARRRRRCPLGERHQPPGQHGEADDRQRRAGHAVEDRDQPYAAPSARWSRCGDKRSRMRCGHGQPLTFGCAVRRWARPCGRLGRRSGRGKISARRLTRS